MQEDIIYKLKALQSIEPDELWMAEKKRRLLERFSVYGVKNDIFLSSKDVYSRTAKLDLRHLLPNGMAVSLASLTVLLTGGMVTLGASQSSLPGDSLYMVKRASEQMALAVASDQDKPKVEIEQAGKRLEELAQVSQMSSDAAQHQKVEQLVSEYQRKVTDANDHLARLSGGSADKTKIADTAKVVTEQSEKYTGVLQTTTSSLPTTIKDKLAVQVADAAKTTEKVNISALMVMVETKGPEDQEVANKVQATVANMEAKVNEAAAVPASPGAESCSGEADGETKIGAAATLPASGASSVALDEAKAKLSNNDLMGSLESVATIIEQESQATSTPPVAGEAAPAENSQK